MGDNEKINDLPKDPFILMSYVNQQLRDNYTNLNEFCEDKDIDKMELIDKLKTSGFEYNPEANKFW